MGGTRIDYSGLQSLVDESVETAERRRRRLGRLRSVPGVVARWATAAAALLAVPFLVVVRSATHAHTGWGWGTAPALALGVSLTAAPILAGAWVLGRRVSDGTDHGDGSPPRRSGPGRYVSLGAAALALVLILHGLVYAWVWVVGPTPIAGTERQIHPLLRVASAPLFLADPAARIVPPRASRREYLLMGLHPDEADLHFPGEGDPVRAMDLQARGLPEWRNHAVELLAWALGFHARRVRGLADHLHVSLRPPPGGADPDLPFPSGGARPIVGFHDPTTRNSRRARRSSWRRIPVSPPRLPRGVRSAPPVRSHSRNVSDARFGASPGDSRI